MARTVEMLTPPSGLRVCGSRPISLWRRWYPGCIVAADTLRVCYNSVRTAVVMKNLFEPETLYEVVSRIDKLQPASPRQWGKMDAAQMMAHCSITIDIASGRRNLPRIFL